jgi:hypothetical protein
MLHRHAPDVVSLVFGILFGGSAAIWLLSETDVIDYQQAWIGGPAILIVAGVVGLSLALRPNRPAEEPPAPWTKPSGGAWGTYAEPSIPVDTEPTTTPDSEPTTPVDTEPTTTPDSEPTTPVDTEPTTPVDTEPTTPVDTERGEPRT